MNKKRNWKQYLFVIKELTGREIKRKYSRSRLGILWSVLNPLFNMAVLSFVFSHMFSKSIENYPIYYLCGNIIWGFYNNGTSSSMTALVDNKNYLIKLRIPMQVFIISRVYTALVNFGYSLMAFIPIIIIYKIRLSWTIVFLPVIVLILTIFILGVSYLLSVACVFFGDINHLYGVFMTLLLFLSAIFYPVERLTGVARDVVSNNPVYLFIKCVRSIIYLGEIPDVKAMITLVIWAFAFYIIGMLVFNRNKNRIIQKL